MATIYKTHFIGKVTRPSNAKSGIAPTAFAMAKAAMVVEEMSQMGWYVKYVDTKAQQLTDHLEFTIFVDSHPFFEFLGDKDDTVIVHFVDMSMVEYLQKSNLFDNYWKEEIKK